jgi:hypothetical protein
MRRVTVHLTAGLAQWVEKSSRELGISQSAFIRAQLVHAELKSRPFMRLAGNVSGARTLSARRGYAAR